MTAAAPSSSASQPRAIVYGYAGSPFFRKLQDLLAWYRVPHAVVQVSMIPPRPMLTEELGITYRRIPVLALDGQIYLDTSLQAEVLERTFAGKEGHGSSLLSREPELQKRLVGECEQSHHVPHRAYDLKCLEMHTLRSQLDGSRNVPCNCGPHSTRGMVQRVH